MYMCANPKLQRRRWNLVAACILLYIVATGCMFLCVAEHKLEQGKFLSDREEKILQVGELALEKGPRNSQFTVFGFKLRHFFSQQHTWFHFAVELVLYPSLKYIHSNS